MCCFAVVFGLAARQLVLADESFLEKFDSAQVPKEYQSAWQELQKLGGHSDPVFQKMLLLGRGFNRGDRIALAVRFIRLGRKLENGLQVAFFSTYGTEKATSDEGVIAALYSKFPKALVEGVQSEGWILGRYQGASEGYPVIVPDLTVFPTEAWVAATQTVANIPPAAALGKLSGNALKVAVLAPLSGPVPTFGVSTRNGALLAISEWNAKGGVLGMKIIPIVEDSQCTPDPAINAANKVIYQDKVQYIIGEVCSKASIPISDIANAAKVIQISPTSTNTAVTVDRKGATKAYIFRACFIDPFQGKVGATFAFKNLLVRNAFVMFDQSDDYVRGLAETFESTFIQLGGKIVGKESYDGATETDFTDILTKVKDSEADIVYLPDYYNVVNLAAKQAKAKGINATFMGGDGWDSSDLDVKAADNGYYTNHYDPSDPRREVQKFLKAYGEAYKDEKGNPELPDALAALAYDAANILLKGIQIAGANNADMVRAALEKGTFDTVLGKVTFDAQHNPVKGAVIIHVTNGQKAFDSFVSPP